MPIFTLKCRLSCTVTINRNTASATKSHFCGLLTCAHDNCLVTAEVKKEKYVYYRCSGGRGLCDLPRFREQEIAEKLGHLLEQVTILPHVAKQIEEDLKGDHVNASQHAAQERARLTRAREDVRRRMDCAYTDKLDRKITEEFWQRETIRLADRRGAHHGPDWDHKGAGFRGASHRRSQDFRTRAKCSFFVSYAQTHSNKARCSSLYF